MAADRAAFERAMEEIEKGLPKSAPGRIERQWKLIREYERQKITPGGYEKMKTAIEHTLEAIARHPEQHPMTASEIILKEALRAVTIS